MYGKIFEEIFDSTLGEGENGWLTIYTFMSMVVLADADGFLKMTPNALFKRMNLHPKHEPMFSDSINILESEDKQSNLPFENGRRAIPLSEIDDIPENRGWFIVNYEYYRDKANRHDLRIKARDRKRRQREREREKVSRNVTARHARSCVSRHTDTDTDTDTDNKEKIYKKEKCKCVWPKNFILDDKKTQYAINNGIDPKKIKEFFAEFKDWALAHDKKYTDWNAAYRNRVRKASEFGKQFLTDGGVKREWIDNA